MRSFGHAWLALTIALARHVADEVLTGFLDVRTLRILAIRVNVAAGRAACEDVTLTESTDVGAFRAFCDFCGCFYFFNNSLKRCSAASMKRR